MREWLEWMDSTRLGRFWLGCFAAVVTLAAWAPGSWLYYGARAPLSWVGLALLAVAQVAVLATIGFFLGAILGPSWTMSMDGDGSGE
jgi:hypothetical protein